MLGVEVEAEQKQCHQKKYIYKACEGSKNNPKSIAIVRYNTKYFAKKISIYCLHRIVNSQQKKTRTKIYQSVLQSKIHI